MATLPTLGPRPIGPNVWTPPDRPPEPPAPEPTVNDEAYRAQLRERLRAIGARAAAGDRNAIDEESKLALTLSRISKVAETTEEITEPPERDFSKLDDVELEIAGALLRKASDDLAVVPLPGDDRLIDTVTTAARAAGLGNRAEWNATTPVGTPAKTPRKRARRAL